MDPSSWVPKYLSLSLCDIYFFSYFSFRISKTKVWNALQKFRSASDLPLEGFGVRDVSAMYPAVYQFICELYGHPEFDNVNDLRVLLANKDERSIACLPPCKDSLDEHIKRAYWQTRIWLHSDIASADLGNPAEYGWEKSEDVLKPVLYSGIGAVQLLSGLYCKCKKMKKNACANNCPCEALKLECIELCNCYGSSCRNPYPLDIEDGEQDDTD